MSQPPFFWRLQWLLVLIIMFMVDFSPIPLSATVMLYVFLFRPDWFKRFIERLYAGK